MTKPPPARPGGLGTTRIAPSPTGTLHLGNARTFLVNWAMARSSGWRVVLRIEDLDATRVRPGAGEQAIELLHWLGIDWDDGPLWQSRDLEPYRVAMRRLAQRKAIFACTRSRRDIERAASAPHGAQGEARCGPGLRPADAGLRACAFPLAGANFRFLVPDERVAVRDGFAGESTHHPFGECGDFIVWTRLGVPAYQLAVVVDDARQGVTDVVRGDDLMASAARQHLLYRALDLAEPAWWHLPLVLGPDGRRLAKRRGDDGASAHLQAFRSAGVGAERVIGLLAAWSGVGQRARPQPMSARDFQARFRLDMLPREPVRFAPAEHAWLLND